MISNQNKDGSWGSHDHPSDRGPRGRPGSPGVQVATVGLSVAALDGTRRTAAARMAVDRAIDWMLDHFDVKRANGMSTTTCGRSGTACRAFEHLLAHPRDPRRRSRPPASVRREARDVPDARRVGATCRRGRADVPAVRDVDELHDGDDRRAPTAPRRSGSSCRRRWWRARREPREPLLTARSCRRLPEIPAAARIT